MSVKAATVGKYAPAASPGMALWLAENSDTLLKIGAVVSGLLFGMMWRAGSMRGEGKSWEAVRADFWISLLILGANTVLTFAVAEWLHAGVGAGMMLGVLVGATGLRALPEIKAALTGELQRRLIGDKVALISPRDEGIDAALRELDKAEKGERS